MSNLMLNPFAKADPFAAIGADAAAAPEPKSSVTGAAAETVATAAAPKVLKSLAGAPLKLLRLSKLTRAGGYMAAAYGLSWAAEKMLDYIHAKSPSSVAVSKADFLAHKIFDTQKFLYGTALDIAGKAVGTTYAAIPQQPPAPYEAPVLSKTPASALTSDQVIIAPKPSDKSIALISEVTPTPTAPISPAVPETHHGDLNALRSTHASADPETERLNRAELARHMPAAEKLAPDGLPSAGGLDCATGITWGPARFPGMKP